MGSLFRKKETTVITTPIPADLSPSAVISSLHHHETIITLAPEVEGHNLLEGNPSQNATYSVTDRKPIGRTTYELNIANHTEGTDTEVTAHPPLGVLKIFGKWRVAKEGNGNVLREDVRIEANRAMIGMVKGNIEKTHGQQHLKVFEKARGKK